MHTMSSAPHLKKKPTDTKKYLKASKDDVRMNVCFFFTLFVPLPK